MQREHRLRTAWGRKERCDRKFHICNRHTLIYTIDLILIKGTQGNYIPWQTSDFEGLISRLPDINEGVGKWIKHLKGRQWATYCLLLIFVYGWHRLSKLIPKHLRTSPSSCCIRMMFSGVATGASDASGTTVDLTYIWH